MKYLPILTVFTLLFVNLGFFLRNPVPKMEGFYVKVGDYVVRTNGDIGVIVSIRGSAFATNKTTINP